MNRFKITTFNCKVLTSKDEKRANTIGVILNKLKSDIYLLQEITCSNITNHILKGMDSKYKIAPTRSTGMRPFFGRKKINEYLICIFNIEKMNVKSTGILKNLNFKTKPIIWLFNIKNTDKILPIVNLHLQYIRKKYAKRKELFQLKQMLKTKDDLIIGAHKIITSDIIFGGDLNFPGNFKKKTFMKIGSFKSNVWKNKAYLKTNSSTKKNCCYDHILFSSKSNFQYLETSILNHNNFQIISDHLPVSAVFSFS
jgi:endonuclease/exonuclease/phosphatase family metal-dependent hydrolase